MPEKISRPPREDLEDCRREGMRLEDIAEIYSVSVSTVKRWIRAENLLTPKKVKRIIMPQPALNKMGSLLDQAKGVLGARIKEHKMRGYFLDGRAVSADDLIRAAGLRPL